VRWHSLLLLGCGGAVIASFSGACGGRDFVNVPWDVKRTVSSSSGDMSGAGGMAGMGGSGAGGAPTADCSANSKLSDKDYFNNCVLGDAATPAGGMALNCTDGNCHRASGIDFLNPIGQEYERITSYVSDKTGQPFLVKSPETKSRLLTHPATPPPDGHQVGQKWFPKDPKHPLYPLYQNTLVWLNREAVKVSDKVVLKTAKIIPKGFTFVSLDPLAALKNDPRLEGAAITFLAIEHSSSLLELSDIKAYPKPGNGMRIENMGIKIVPKDKTDGPVNKTLYGEPLTFVTPKKNRFCTDQDPKNPDQCTGTALLTDWSPGASIFLVFDNIEGLLADKNGNAFSPCVDVPGFAKAAEALPYFYDFYQCAGLQGMQACGRQCHGGTDYPLNKTFHTTKMDVLSLYAKPPDYELACAVTRAFTTPGNPAKSRILLATEPGGATAHKQFTFCATGPGSTGHDSWKKFRETMTPWICSESKDTPTMCGTACANLTSDVDNCGSCGKKCATKIKGEVCESSKCGCPSSKSDICNDTCIDLKSDFNNCGMCAKSCMSGENCTGGVCCSPGKTGCNGTCVDLKTDDKNCGLCGKACEAGKSCKDGLCQ
jgi:hypothetical protein